MRQQICRTRWENPISVWRIQPGPAGGRPLVPPQVRDTPWGGIHGAGKRATHGPREGGSQRGREGRRDGKKGWKAVTKRATEREKGRDEKREGWRERERG